MREYLVILFFCNCILLEGRKIANMNLVQMLTNRKAFDVILLSHHMGFYDVIPEKTFSEFKIRDINLKYGMRGVNW